MSHASYLRMSLIRLLLQQLAQGDGQGAFHQLGKFQLAQVHSVSAGVNVYSLLTPEINSTDRVPLCGVGVAT